MYLFINLQLCFLTSDYKQYIWSINIAACTSWLQITAWQHRADEFFLTFGGAKALCAFGTSGACKTNHVTFLSPSRLLKTSIARVFMGNGFVRQRRLIVKLHVASSDCIRMDFWGRYHGGCGLHDYIVMATLNFCACQLIDQPGQTEGKQLGMFGTPLLSRMQMCWGGW